VGGKNYTCLYKGGKAALKMQVRLSHSRKILTQITRKGEWREYLYFLRNSR